MDSDRKASIGTFAATLIGAAIAVAGSQGGSTAGGMPVFAVLIGLAFVIQWLVFIPSYLRQTERFYDLTGATTYISVTVLAVLLSPPVDARSLLLLALVVIWAGRLGTFLFRRIRQAGKDDRFDQIKTSFARFLSAWTIQGLWVSLTAAAALAAITSEAGSSGLDVFAAVGLLIWITGFSIEAIADLQKNRFRADPENRGGFIHTGLWSWSRHPNYFGEIVIWIGVAVIALPVLEGWQLATIISPVFVYVLLTRISGVPMLEDKADTRWGEREDYRAYKARTSILVPVPPRR
ncbi:MAG: DUF1295 domain-containing protein [Coriobacteriia bacterium]